MNKLSRKATRFVKRAVSLALAVTMVLETVKLDSFAEVTGSTQASQAEAPSGAVCELKDRRGLYSKEYLMQDGSCEIVFYPEQIHYEDENGELQEIDTSLEKTGEGFTGNANGNEISIGEDGQKGAVSFRKDGYGISWNLLEESGKESKLSASVRNYGGAEGNTAEGEITDPADAFSAEQSSVTIRGYEDGVKIEYTPKADGIKENIILTKKGDRSSFTFAVDTEGLSWSLEEDNTVVFSDRESGDPLFYFPAPFMTDADGALSYDVRYEVSETPFEEEKELIAEKETAETEAEEKETDEAETEAEEKEAAEAETEAEEKETAEAEKKAAEKETAGAETEAEEKETKEKKAEEKETEAAAAGEKKEETAAGAEGKNGETEKETAASEEAEKTEQEAERENSSVRESREEAADKAAGDTRTENRASEETEDLKETAGKDGAETGKADRSAATADTPDPKEKDTETEHADADHAAVTENETASETAEAETADASEKASGKEESTGNKKEETAKETEAAETAETAGTAEAAATAEKAETAGTEETAEAETAEAAAAASDSAVKQGTADRIYLRITADEAWLQEASYPVTIDPVLKEIDTRTRFESVCIASNGKQYKNLYAGRSKGVTYRSLVRFDLSKIPANALVSEAKFYVCSTENKRNAAVRMAEEDWSLSGDGETGAVSWENQPAGSGVMDYVDLRNGQYFDITEPVRKWVTGEKENCGIILSALNEDEEGTCSIIPRKEKDGPCLTVTYRTSTGLESYRGAHSVSAGTAGTGYVNDCLGYLTVVSSGVSSAGLRMPLSIGQVYNSNDVRNGNGWRWGYQESIRIPLGSLDPEEYLYIYTDGDGTEHAFKKEGEVIFNNSGQKETRGNAGKDEDSLGLYIVPVSDSTLKKDYPTRLTNQSGSARKYFDAYGRLAMITDSNRHENGSNASSKAANRILIHYGEPEETQGDMTIFITRLSAKDTNAS